MTPLLDIEAAATYLNVSPRWVADHIRASPERFVADARPGSPQSA